MANMLSPLATPAATRDVLEEHGLSTKHALGQNFLVNDAILQKIVELAQLDASDDVLEVGPGIGTPICPRCLRTRSSRGLIASPSSRKTRSN